MASSLLPFGDNDCEYSEITSSGITFHIWKWQSGFMMMTFTVTININTNAARYFKKKGTITVNFPVSFDADAYAPYSFVNPVENAGWWIANSSWASSGSCGVGMAGDTTGNKQAEVIVIGRWK